MNDYSASDFAKLRELATLLQSAPHVIEALDQLAAKSAELRAEVDRCNKARGELVAAASAHEQRLAELSAAQVNQHQKRKDEIARGKSALEGERRALAAERRRVTERERWVEHRAADLTNRLRGAA
jgi:chromosome segregation ATPase